MNERRDFIRAAIAAALPAAGLASGNARAAEQASPGRRTTYPNVVMQDEQARRLKFYDDCLKGRIVIMNMMYTTCTGICPPNTAALKAIRDTLGERVGRDIFIYSLTLRPEFDTPEALRAYAQKFGITQPGWHFLTGAPGDMEQVRRRMGFYDVDPAIDSDLSRHTGMLRIGSERLDRWFMTPTLSPVRQIVDQIRTLPS